MNEFDITKDYYAILGVSQDASREEIIAAYNNPSVVRTPEEQAEVNEAFYYLFDSRTRKEYDSGRARYLKEEARKAAREERRRSRVVNTEEATETATKGRNTLRNVGLTALVVLAIAGAGVIGWQANEISHLKKDATCVETVVQDVEEETIQREITEVTTEAPVETTTEAPVETTTEAPVETTTEAPVETTTEAPVETTTEAPVETTTVTPTPTEAPTPTLAEVPNQTEVPASSNGIADIELIGSVGFENGGSVNATDVESNDITNTVVLDETGITATVDGSATMNEVKSFGNALDDAQVTERAQKLLDYINSINAYNINTGMPYSLEELKNMVKYLNGAYVPTSEANAFSMEDEFLSFVCVPLNDPAVINGVNLQMDCFEGGNYIATPINFTDLLLMGDSYSYPYLQWIQEEYKTLSTSESKEARIAIVNEVFQSYADIVYGDGYNLKYEGKEIVVTANDLANRTKINDGNVFRLYGLIFPVFRAGANEVLTVQTANGEITVNLEDVITQFNVKCPEDIAAEASYDTGGRLQLPINENVDNLYDRIQTNTVSFATDNLYFGNTSYYEETQTLSLK